MKDKLEEEIMKTLISNVKIVTPFELLYDHSLIIKEDKIEDIVADKDLNLKDFKKVIDGQGLYLAPGFVDIHNHGNSGFDVMDSSEEALDKIGAYHISNGVTSYLGTVITSSYDSISNAIKNIVTYKNKDDKARIIGIHLEGPFFNILKKGAQPEEYIASPNIEKIKKILDLSKGNLKMLSLAPELPGSMELIEFLKQEDVVVAMAHSNGEYKDIKKAIGKGVTLATHLYNGMRNFTHREPGIIGASLTDERVYCELIYDRFHLHDVAVKIALKMKGYDKIVLVSDAMRAAGLEDGEYDLGGQKVFVKDKLPRLKSGSIAGSTLDLQRAVYNMIHYLQVPIKEAVKMASLNPAKAINVDKDLGSIEIGKNADLILFDENIDIKQVFIGGKLSWKKN